MKIKLKSTTSCSLIASLVCLVLVVESNGSPRCPQYLPSTSSMRLFRNSCYHFVSEERYWSDANNFCKLHGGHLAKIDDAETNQVIVSTLNGLWWTNQGVWIGLHDTESELNWKWLGQDSAVRWTNWGHGHPGAMFHHVRDCVRMVRNDGWRWHETPCSSLKWHYRFICQYKATSVASSSDAIALRPTLTPKKTDPPTVMTTTAKTTRQERRMETAGVTTNKQTTFLGHHGAEYVEVKLTNLESDNQNLENTKHEESDEDSALMSSQVVSQDDAKKKDFLAIVMPTIFICLLTVFLIVVFWRRRRKNLQKFEALVTDSPLPTETVKPEKLESKKLDSVLLNVAMAQSLANRRAVSNLYIDAEIQKFYREEEEQESSSEEPIYSMPDKPTVNYCPMNGCGLPRDNRASYLPMSNPTGYMNATSPDDVSSSTATSDNGGQGIRDNDCGMMGYDVPKTTHIYSEIPDADRDQDSNIYEDLDNI